MGRLKLRYREGDVFQVPMGNGRSALGVVARADGTGGFLGYFFDLSEVSAPEELAPHRAVFIGRVGDMALMGDGYQRRGQGPVQWPVIGHLSTFSRAAWPVPTFYREFGQRLVHYDDTARSIVSEMPAGPEHEGRLPLDGAYTWTAAVTSLRIVLARRAAA